MKASLNVRWRGAALLGVLAAAALEGAAAVVSAPVPARLSGLRVGADGGVVLDVASSGQAGEVLDLFSTDSLTEPAWQLRGAYLRAEGQPSFQWADAETGSGGWTKSRFYRVGRADIDLNENGLPDDREALIHIHDLPETARARWARAGLGAPATNYATVVNVRDYGAKGDGATDDAAAISSAVSKAPAGSVVYLPAGTYRLLSTLSLKSDMILRGDGPALTSLIFEGSGTANRCIAIIRWDSEQPADTVAVTDGMALGSTRVTVASVSGFQPGDIIEIDEDNDPAWGWTEAWQLRLPGQMNRVLAVDVPGKVLTLDRHLRHAFTTARNPRVHRLVTRSNIGIENLFIRRKDAVVGYTVEMKYAVRCWIKNVESYMTYKSHVWMERGFECEVRQSYFHDAFSFGGGGEGYGVGCGKRTSDCLVEDNIFQHLRHAMIVGIGASGNVYGYNYSTDRALDPVSGTPQADISVHGNYVFMNLFEGNVLEDADVPDWYWPAGPGNTLFRNRISNSGTAIDAGSDNQNFLGNVLTRGTLSAASTLQGIVDYGNVKQGNTAAVTWPGCSCHTLPDSLYRCVPPDFVRRAGVAWPPIGPERPLDSPTPSSLRFASGQYVP